LVELAAVAIFVRCDDKLVSAVLEELPEAELARNTTEQITRGEVDGTGTRRRGPVGVPLDIGLYSEMLEMERA
jgi:hypothetical protein